jgi:hypothetical protein
MIKSLIKIAIAVLLANALWRVSSAYISYYRFKDSVDELATHSGGKNDAQIKDKVLELAATYEEPVDPDAIEIRHEADHLYIATEYTKPIALFPGYVREWPFTLSVDGYLIIPTRLNDLAHP